MKKIKNEAVTGKMIILKTPQGPKGVWLSPKEEVVVPESYLSTTIKNLQKRKILRILNA